MKKDHLDVKRTSLFTFGWYLSVKILPLSLSQWFSWQVMFQLYEMEKAECQIRWQYLLWNLTGAKSHDIGQGSNISIYPDLCHL